jgi:hypothetical protein
MLASSNARTEQHGAGSTASDVAAKQQQNKPETNIGRNSQTANSGLRIVMILPTPDELAFTSAIAKPNRAMPLTKPSNAAPKRYGRSNSNGPPRPALGCANPDMCATKEQHRRCEIVKKARSDEPAVAHGFTLAKMAGAATVPIMHHPALTVPYARNAALPSRTTRGPRKAACPCACA